MPASCGHFFARDLDAYSLRISPREGYWVYLCFAERGTLRKDIPNSPPYAVVHDLRCGGRDHR